MGFHLYEFGINKVITKSGQDDVSTTGQSILSNNGLNGMLRSQHHRPWAVYAGYHGDMTGRFAIAFNVGEMMMVNSIASQYPRAVIHHVPKEMTDDEIVKAARANNVFFTWCDSNTRVPALLRNHAGWGKIRDLV